MSFRSVVSAASEQYQEIKQSLKLFPYFETWDENVIDECCRLSSIKEYPEDYIILGSCSESTYMAFFILDGICKIIHHLQVHEKVNSYGKTTYKLFQPTDPKSPNSEFTKIEYTSMLFNEMHKFQKSSVVKEPEDEILNEKIPKDEVTNSKPLEGEMEENKNFCEEEDEKKENFVEEENKEKENVAEEENEEKRNAAEEETENKEMFVRGENEVENENCNLESFAEKDKNKDEKENDSSSTSRENELEESLQDSTVLQQDIEKDFELTEASRENVDDDSDEGIEGEINVRPIGGGQAEEKSHKENHETSIKENVPSEPTTNLEEIKSATEKDKNTEEEIKVTYDENYHLKILEECKAKAKQHIRTVGQRWTTNRPKGVKSFFVQVGLFYKGSCFGLEEHLKDTVVMSATKVKCLRIPRRFLFQHNPCNIWNRIRLFFSLHLPTEEQILEYFSSNRAWLKKKQNMSEEISALKKISNYTLCSDVPYGIRLLQEF